MISLYAVCATHRGKVREANEDRLVVGPWVLGPGAPGVTALWCPAARPWVAVFDGMGGHASGAAASSTAAEALANCQGMPGDAEVRQVVSEVNAAVYRRMDDDPALRGMGSTIVGLTLIGTDLVVFNVGDSRAYQWRDGYLIAVSTDDASARGFLTASLGGRNDFEPVDPHLALVPVGAGATVLLASDGLFGHVDVEQLEREMQQGGPQAVQQLVDTALEAGGPDNVTVALVTAVVNDERTGSW